jgi:hypothetical protein
MTHEFIEKAKEMLTKAGFKTADNTMYVRGQRGFRLNPELNATFTVEFNEYNDVWIESHVSDNRREREQFAPCYWGWKSLEQQVNQLQTKLQNCGCKMILA